MFNKSNKKPKQTPKPKEPSISVTPFGTFYINGAKPPQTNTNDSKRNKYPQKCPNCNALLNEKTLPHCEFCGAVIKPID